MNEELLRALIIVAGWLLGEIIRRWGDKIPILRLIDKDKLRALIPIIVSVSTGAVASASGVAGSAVETGAIAGAPVAVHEIKKTIQGRMGNGKAKKES
ncbi:MAG: hypothetical protein KatS3mg054_0124 [Chloroflexus sp.]|nr:MAG: hypothetical protein KatS3mg054_0124 [Chloroflexus sp.]